MIETQIAGRQPPGFDLVADIARAENAGGETDERVEHDEDDIEIVGEEKVIRWRTGMEQRHREGEDEAAEEDVEPRRQAIIGDESEHRGADERGGKQRQRRD